MLIKNSLLKILWFFPALLSLSPFIFSKSDSIVLPSKNEYKIASYGDSTNENHHSLHSLSKVSDSMVVFNYTLSKKNLLEGNDPYAGIIIDLKNNNTFLDISSASHLSVDIVTKQGTSFNIQLKYFIEGFTVCDSFRTYHIETCQVPVHLGSKRYSIPLDNFRIPDWWYKEVGEKAASLPRTADNTKLFGINFQSGSGTQENVPDQFEITRIVFSKDQTVVRLLCLGFGIAYIVLVLSLQFFFRKRRISPGVEPTLAYQPLDIKNHSDEETKRLVEYLGAHFQEPELTVEQVGKGSGITPSQIPIILQQKFGKAFKSYLNEVRITESKRLLRETDRTITEISYSVGYNNVTHFNRVFRQIEEISPTGYRENQKKI